MISLDGSQGEGGGQILRSALALSLVTGRPFRIDRIRARRPKPGLMRQHLACVDAAARIGSARVEGAALGSHELAFAPGTIQPGTYEFRISSAGSTMLLLQTVLPPLLSARQPSELVLEGGTHNSFAPPFPFVERAFLPLLRRIGFDVEARLERPGFYPVGGGRCRVVVRPTNELNELRLDGGSRPMTTEEDVSPGADRLSALACLSGLPRSVGEREIAVVRRRLGLVPERGSVEEYTDAIGPGNTAHVFVAGDGFANVFTGFGALRVRAEQVAEEAVESAERFLASGAVVEEHLADQLLLPLALARGGSFLTTEPSAHTRTNANVLREFLPVTIDSEPVGPATWRLRIKTRSSS